MCARQVYDHLVCFLVHHHHHSLLLVSIYHLDMIMSFSKLARRILVAAFFCFGFTLVRCDRSASPKRNCSNGGESMIVNGDLVVPGEAKHQLALLRFEKFICGASLIAPRSVLTAAHCVDGYELNGSNFAVRYNSLDVNSGPTIPVLRVVMHPAFTARSFNYDLAILTLTEPIVVSDNVDVIAIEPKELSDRSTLSVTGWGQSGPTEPASQYLMKAELTKWSQTDCFKTWNAAGQPITETMYCASSLKQSSCKGDSGGPVTQDGKLVGVVSWGSKFCLDEELPNVFVKLAREDIREWIVLNVVDSVEMQT